MKKLLILTLALLTLGCESDPVQDCNCDRVIQVEADINDPVWFYITKNDCSGKVMEWPCDPNNHPNVGDCK